MRKHFDVILQAANNHSDSVDDKEVVCSLIANNCVYLLNESYECITNGRSTFAFPLLRQVYEYTIIVMGLSEPIISISHFVNATSKLVGDISSKIHGVISKKQGFDKAEQIKRYFQAIQAMLNVHTHANIDRLLAYTVESTFGQSGRDYFSADANILYSLVEINFLSTIKDLYKLEIDIDPVDLTQYQKRTRHLISSNELPPEIFNRLLQIEPIKLKMAAKKDEIKQMAIDWKEYQKLKAEETIDSEDETD